MTRSTLAAVCSTVLATSACSGTSAPGAAKTSGVRHQVVYDLYLQAAVEERTQTLRRDLDAALADRKLLASTALSMGGVITVTPSDAPTRLVIEPLVRDNYRDLVAAQPCAPSAPAEAICLALAPSYADTVRKAALATAADAIRARLAAAGAVAATVVEAGDQLVVGFAVAEPDDEYKIRSLVVRTGRFAAKLVDDGASYMKGLADLPGEDAAVAADLDQWSGPDGAVHADLYLRAYDQVQQLSPQDAHRIGCVAPDIDERLRCAVTGRVVLEQFFRQRTSADPTLRPPDDRELAYQPVVPATDAPASRPYWRTYLLERAVRLASTDVARARGTSDPATGRPLVELELDRDGQRAFAELTGDNVGRKLALLVDGIVLTAPVIEGEIRGGRTVIPVDSIAQRDELVTVLTGGALPVPLREASATVVAP